VQRGVPLTDPDGCLVAGHPGRNRLVLREGCPTDRRGAFVALTSAGRTALEAAAPGHVEAVRRSVFDVLTPAQVSSLGEICAELLVGLEPEGGCGAASDTEPC